jgi:hypothetical protein
MGSYGKNDNYNPSRKADSRASGNSGLCQSQVAGTSQFPNIEIIEDRLYWVSGPRPPTRYSTVGSNTSQYELSLLLLERNRINNKPFS